MQSQKSLTLGQELTEITNKRLTDIGRGRNSWDGNQKIRVHQQLTRMRVWAKTLHIKLNDVTNDKATLLAQAKQGISSAIILDDDQSEKRLYPDVLYSYPPDTVQETPMFRRFVQMINVVARRNKLKIRMKQNGEWKGTTFVPSGARLTEGCKPSSRPRSSFYLEIVWDYGTSRSKL